MRLKQFQNKYLNYNRKRFIATEFAITYLKYNEEDAIDSGKADISTKHISPNEKAMDIHENSKCTFKTQTLQLFKYCIKSFTN